MNARDVFFNDIYVRTCSGADIMVVSSDLGAPSLDNFRKDFPHRFVNVGIAEQNSVAVAAGLVLSGKIAVTYGLNPFPATRAFDQIRNLMASLRIPVTVAALKAGTCTAEAGFSHMAIENLSLLRTLRNLRIINPSDETIAKKTVAEIINNPLPRFIQFDPFVSEAVYRNDEIDFDIGFAVSGNDSDVAIVTYGEWAKTIQKQHFEAKIIDCFCLPVDKDALIGELNSCRKIITVEDGVAEGGIGSMVLEILNDYGINIPVARLALRFAGGYPEEYTGRQMIFASEGITVDKIKELIG